MIGKVIIFGALVALTQAQHGHHATSYSSISTHAAPSYQHAAPVASYHQAQVPVYHAPVQAYHAPALIKSAPHYEEYHGHAKYEFKYGVEDKHTGDIKNQHEARDGDVVQGEYSLVQPDGILRTVKYTADKSGFNAHVGYSGHASHPQSVHKAVIAPAYH